MYIVCTQIKDIYQALSGYVIKISLIFYLMNEEIQNMLRYFNENYRTLDFHVCNIREQVHVSKKVVFLFNLFLFLIPKNPTLLFFQIRTLRMHSFTNAINLCRYLIQQHQCLIIARLFLESRFCASDRIVPIYHLLNSSKLCEQVQVIHLQFST